MLIKPTSPFCLAYSYYKTHLSFLYVMFYVLYFVNYYAFTILKGYVTSM